MAFISLLAYIIMIYMRPQEWVQVVHGLPLLNITAIITVVLFVIGKKNKLVSVPQNVILIFFLCALMLSHLSQFYFGNTLATLVDFSKTVIVYFLIVNIINSEKKIIVTCKVLVWLTVVLALQGYWQSKTGFGLAAQPILSNEDGTRITWIGIFDDPNDLALGFVMVIPFVLLTLLKERFLGKMLSLVALVSLMYGIYLTNSRGGVLASGAVFASFFYNYVKNKKVFLLGLLVVATIAIVGIRFGPSRMTQMSSEEESSHGRIDAWYEGFEMFKSAPVFGVGYMMFTEHHYLTAHNSFVLCFAETGFLGYFLWVSLFYLSFKSLAELRKMSERSAISEFFRLYSYALQSSLIGFLTAAFFLSRTYVVLPYILIALIGAMYAIGQPNIRQRNKLINMAALRNIFVISVASMLFIYVFVKLTI